jgi:Arc/MetJ-type ribon-helix-helix transcriptional regulator
MDKHMNAHMTRWTVVVDKKLDRDLRLHIAKNGGKKGDISEFVRRSVELELIRKAWSEASALNADLSEADIMDLVNHEIKEHRAGR